jgi:hypothetical protein
MNTQNPPVTHSSSSIFTTPSTSTSVTCQNWTPVFQSGNNKVHWPTYNICTSTNTTVTSTLDQIGCY